MSRSLHPIIAVLMYHSISDNAHESPYGHLSIPVRVFETMLSYLHQHKFRTITLNDLHDHLCTGEQLPAKPIVITFDDGYLDTWVNAFPLLKKYGMKATVFVVPEFVDRRNCIRPSLLDVWQRKLDATELGYWGFLSWNEMKQMSASGLIDVESHSLTHTFHFQGSEIIDFHHPGDSYPWLAWNKYPERKYLWPTEDQQELVPFGSPIYTHGRALERAKYLPDESLARFLEDYVKQNGGRHFFRNTRWREQLFNIAANYRGDAPSRARYESQSEYEERVRNELMVSKELIERKLGKKINYLCWPGGAVNETTFGIAQSLGYLATSKGQSRNKWGTDPRRFHRVGGDVRLTGIHPLLDKYVARLLFAGKVESYRGEPIYSTVFPLALKTARACRWLLSAPWRPPTMGSEADLHKKA